LPIEVYGRTVTLSLIYGRQGSVVNVLPSVTDKDHVAVSIAVLLACHACRQFSVRGCGWGQYPGAFDVYRVAR